VLGAPGESPGCQILSSIRRTTTSVFVPTGPEGSGLALLIKFEARRKTCVFSMESLILAQDERWRRASHMQVERGSFGGNIGEGRVANG
jgi:hypothetical protein